ncbi:hypothetical protein FRC03_003827 [Tulasnella sp. 419]|nr:hypothetical protein FRC03_003827 [Tulasnella sp. 419]
MVFIMMAMTILRGISMAGGVFANQLRSFVSASIKSLEAALPWNVNSPPQLKTPPTPRIRRVGFSNEVKQKTSSPPRNRSQYLFEALSKARAQPKIASTPRTSPPVTYLPATRRMAFSSWVEVQEYHLEAAPKRIQADRHRAGLHQPSCTEIVRDCEPSRSWEAQVRLARARKALQDTLALPRTY